MDDYQSQPETQVVNSPVMPEGQSSQQVSQDNSAQTWNPDNVPQPYTTHSNKHILIGAIVSVVIVVAIILLVSNNLKARSYQQFTSTIPFNFSSSKISNLVNKTNALYGINGSSKYIEFISTKTTGAYMSVYGHIKTPRILFHCSLRYFPSIHRSR